MSKQVSLKAPTPTKNCRDVYNCSVILSPGGAKLANFAFIYRSCRNQSENLKYPSPLPTIKCFTMYTQNLNIEIIVPLAGQNTRIINTRKNCVKNCWGSRKKSLKITLFHESTKGFRCMSRIFEYFHKSKPAFAYFPRN